MKKRLVIGTRKSALALWQSEFVKKQLEDAIPGLTVDLHHVVTTGDRTQDSKAAIPVIGGKGLFTAELEECLERGEVDLAVHSLKDLPTEMPSKFVIGAIPPRAPAEDVLISRIGATLATLPAGSVVGTSSLRRVSQILRVRPDLRTSLIRGNVDSRLRKLRAEGGEYDAIVLARAGVERLGLANEVTEILSFSTMLPAPGQGALGIECRAGDEDVLGMVSRLHDVRTAACVTAERMFLQRLGAGCNTPVAALVRIENRSGREMLTFEGRCLAPDASRCIEVRGEALFGEERELGIRMAEEAMSKGFSEIDARG
jgi:hydroxymethylbilane synthase